MFAIFFAIICKSKAEVVDVDFFEEDSALMDTLGRRYQLKNGEEYLHEEICESATFIKSPRLGKTHMDIFSALRRF